MPFLFQMQASSPEQAVKQAVAGGKSGVFEFARLALVKMNDPDSGTFYIKAIIPVKPGALAGVPSEKLVSQATDELLKLTAGIATVEKVELKDTFNLLTLKSGKEVVANLKPEMGFV